MQLLLLVLGGGVCLGRERAFLARAMRIVSAFCTHWGLFASRPSQPSVGRAAALGGWRWVTTASNSILRRVMPSLRGFGADELRECSDAIRALHLDARSMEEAAQRVVRYLYDSLCEEDGTRSCVLVRLYKTQTYGTLEPGLQEFARNVAGEDLAPSDRCLTLLATGGDVENWWFRDRSRGHKAIPLASEQMVERFPMVSQLLRQLGVDVASMMAPPSERLRQMARQTYDVFHVGDALGSPHIPAQEDFVVPHQVRSAIGFGGFLFTGDLYAVILFSRVPVSRHAAEYVRLLSLAVRVPLLAFGRGPVFDTALPHSTPPR